MKWTSLQRVWLVVVTFVLLVSPLLTPAAAAGTIRKLNSPLPANGDTSDYRLSPDGRWVVYLADQETDGIAELWSVPSGGGTPMRLHPLLPADRSISGFHISGDSSRVVYRADQQTNDVEELYSVPLTGPASAAVKLNNPLVAGGAVAFNSFQITPDSSRVVYRADQQTNDVFELYSVPLVGPASAGVKLNSPLVAGGDVDPFQISGDSNQVVYVADQQANDVRELYSVPLVGPANVGVKLNSVLVAGGAVLSFRISVDSKRVVYQADQQTNDVFDLYSVPLVGPANVGVKLNGPLVVGGAVFNFQISGDSSRVVYGADQQTDEVFELYSVPLVGPANAGVKLNGPLVAGGDVDFLEFQISGDSSRVVYGADQQTDDVRELYSVPLAGPANASVKLNGALVTGGDVAYSSFKISEDNSRVVYMADQQTDEVRELYSVPLVGPANIGVKLNGPLVVGGVVFNFQISGDSSRAVYVADQETNDVFELYSVPVVGPASGGNKINGPLVTGGDVDSFQISADSSRVVYRADQQMDDVVELYVTDVGSRQVAFSLAMQMVDEAVGTTTLTVRLSAPALDPISVSYSVTGGTATNGSDYTLAAGSLTFDPEETTKTITVPLTDDAADEVDETVVVTLSDPTNGAMLGPSSSTTLTLLDNDEPAPTSTPTAMSSPTATTAVTSSPTVTSAASATPTSGMPASSFRVYLPLVQR